MQDLVSNFVDPYISWVFDRHLKNSNWCNNNSSFLVSILRVFDKINHGDKKVLYQYTTMQWHLVLKNAAVYIGM